MKFETEMVIINILSTIGALTVLCLFGLSIQWLVNHVKIV